MYDLAFHFSYDLFFLILNKLYKMVNYNIFSHLNIYPWYHRDVHEITEIK